MAWKKPARNMFQKTGYNSNLKLSKLAPGNGVI